MCSNLAVAPKDEDAENKKSESAPATGTELRLIKCISPWGAERAANLNYPLEHLPEITAMALSANGKLLAWGDQENNVMLYFLEQDSLSVLNDMTVSHAWPKPRQVARLEYVFSEEDKKFLRERGVEIRPSQPVDSLNPIESIRFQQDNALFWISILKGVWRVNIEEGKAGAKSCINPHPPAGFSPIFTEDALISATDKSFFSHEYELRKYDLKTFKLQAKCQIYPRGKYYHWVNVSALSPDGSLLAIASDGNSGLVSIKDFKLIQTLNVKYATGFAISPDNSRVAVGNRKDEILVLEAAGGKVIQTMTGMPPRGGTSYSMTFENRDLLWFDFGGYLYRLDVATGNSRVFRKGSDATVMLLDRAKRHLYLGCRDGSVYIYQLPPAAIREPENKGPEKH